MMKKPAMRRGALVLTLWFGAFALASLGFGPGARAQDAKALYEQGMQALTGGRYKEAA